MMFLFWVVMSKGRKRRYGRQSLEGSQSEHSSMKQVVYKCRNYTSYIWQRISYFDARLKHKGGMSKLFLEKLTSL